jgi:transcriptional regulator with XRE-family HTH domain
MSARKPTPQVLFGEVVRSERRRQRLTQEELAHRSGISAVFLSDIERGVENASIATLAKLARGLGTGLGQLLVRAQL